MNLNAELNAKIRLREERRKEIQDPNIDQLRIVGLTRGLRRLDREIENLKQKIYDSEI
jgi:hypothetical protein